MMPFTAAKLGALQRSAIVIVRVRWEPSQGSSCARRSASSLFGRWWSSAFRLTTPIFVARGPALLFGISRWLSQHGISRKRRNNLTRVLTRVLIAVERSTQESKANSSHPSSREGHRCAGLSLRQFGVRRSDCRRHFPCPAELGSITPHTMHNHGEPSCQCDDGFFLPPTLGNVHRPCLQPRPFLHAGQHDLRGLIEQRSHGFIRARAGAPVSRLTKPLRLRRLNRAAASEFDWTSAAKDALLCASAGGFGYPPARLGLASRFAGLWVVRASIPTPRTNGAQTHVVPFRREVPQP